MAAFETPWLTHMSSSMSAAGDADRLSSSSHSSQSTTRAAFSPPGAGNIPSSSQSSQKATVVVHEKSPLLVATPPQITRALSHLYPYLLLLNWLAGLLTWTTGDIWESFLLLAGFWAITLYGDCVMRYAGPLVVVSGLMVALHVRRRSTLFLLSESTGKNGDQKGSGKSVSHRRSLDDIVDCVTLFTARCDVLLEPFLQVTNFLSMNRTTRSTTSTASSQPVLLTLFIRALFMTPVWIILSLPPLRIVTAKRAVLVIGTTIMTWHSPAAKISRTLLWRSRTVRHLCQLVTGLRFSQAKKTGAFRSLLSSFRLGGTARKVADSPEELVKQQSSVPKSIRFTFTLYENQRRWLGIGWTSSMLAYERPAWTDERLNPKPPKEKFRLPEVEGAHAKWRWVEGSEWEIDVGNDVRGSKNSEADQGWIYYDNKWRNGKRQDGWGKYTRRRKWCRDAELVEITPASTSSPSSSVIPTQHLSASSSNLTPSLTPSTPSTITESSSPPPYSQTESSNTASTSSTTTEQLDQQEKQHQSKPTITSKGRSSDSNTTTTSSPQSITASHHAYSTNDGNPNINPASLNFNPSPEPKPKDKKGTGKFRKGWFSGSSNKSNSNASSDAGNSTGGLVNVNLAHSRRRSSGSNHSSGFGSSYKGDARSSVVVGGASMKERERFDKGVGVSLGDDAHGGAGGGGARDDGNGISERGERDELSEVNQVNEVDGREAVGTPMGTQEELDHYAYGRGLGEDAMMGLG